MNKRIAACEEIKKRIKDVHLSIGLKTFIRTPTKQAKVEQMPVCFMTDGVDNIIKRSSRTTSASRKGEDNVRALEVILEIVAPVSANVVTIYKKVRKAVLADPYPVKNPDGSQDGSTYMYEERTEGPIGSGMPEIEAMVFIITLVYVDDMD